MHNNTHHSNHHYPIYDSQLGWITEAIAAGASIFDSISDRRTEKKANESLERQQQTEIQAQQLRAEANIKLLKYAIIGGSVLLFGTIIISSVAKAIKPGNEKEKLKGVKGSTKKTSKKL